MQHKNRMSAHTRSACRRQWLDSAQGASSREGAEVLAANAAEEATAAVEMSVKRVGAIDDLQCLDNDLDSSPSSEQTPDRYTSTSRIFAVSEEHAACCCHASLCMTWTATPCCFSACLLFICGLLRLICIGQACS